MAAIAEQASLSLHIYRLLSDGQKTEQIITELTGKGYDEAFITELVQETGKLRFAKRRTQGLVLILSGAVICLASCLITIAGGSTGNLSTVLYGMTTIGILIVFAGLTKVF